MTDATNDMIRHLREQARVSTDSRWARWLLSQAGELEEPLPRSVQVFGWALKAVILFLLLFAGWLMAAALIIAWGR